jgi:putative acetyltransferase
MDCPRCGRYARRPPTTLARFVTCMSARSRALRRANLVDALRSFGASVPWLCLVALAGDSVVDIAFSRAHLDSGHPLLVLAPMGVLPAHQGRGAGAALVSEGLRRAAETEFPLVAVVGHAAYYPRFGFEPAAALGLEAPFDLPAEAWRAYRLPEYTPAARGTVVYPEAFAVRRARRWRPGLTLASARGWSSTRWSGCAAVVVT